MEILRDFDAVVEHLENELSVEELIILHNEYCQHINSEDEIYDNDDEFFEVYFTKPLDAIRAVHYGEYEYTDSYVKFNGYANLESSNDPTEWICTNEIAQHILDNEHLYDFDLFDEDEDSDEEE